VSRLGANPLSGWGVKPDTALKQALFNLPSETLLMTSRRAFAFSTSAAAVSCLAIPGLAQAQGTPKEGQNYRLVNPIQPVEVPGKIEVIDFFWYACPHCNALAPAMKEWAKKLPADVAYRKIHVPFNEEKHQQLFYTLESLGKVAELNDKVFAAIHIERNRMDTPEKMAEVLAKAGLDAKLFRDTYDSFSVKTKMRKATATTAAFKLDGVPQIAVNGRYITAPSMAGGNGQAIAVADYLIDLERKRK
jgi:protein dithiol oxidoreductase (disulfide-forming)